MKSAYAAAFSAVMLTTAAVPAAGLAADERQVPAMTISLETAAPYYDPFVAIVPAGVPIRWFNPTASPHSVRHDGCLGDDTCAFQSAAFQPADSFMIAPLPPGRYGYHCELHPIMRGTLVVLGDAVTEQSSMGAQAIVR
jgi:plastocyanin